METAWEHQLQSILGRRNVFDLFGDQRGRHCGRRTMKKGMQTGEEVKEEQGQVTGPAAQRKTSEFIYFKACSSGRRMNEAAGVEACKAVRKMVHLNSEREVETEKRRWLWIVGWISDIF